MLNFGKIYHQDYAESMVWSVKKVPRHVITLTVKTLGFALKSVK